MSSSSSSVGVKLLNCFIICILFVGEAIIRDFIIIYNMLFFFFLLELRNLLIIFKKEVVGQFLNPCYSTI